MGFAMKLRFVDVICDDSLRNIYINGKKSGYQFDIRLGYYRGLYLSCIDRFEVIVDGEKVADEDITFSINQKEFSVYELPYCRTEFWHLIEPARISVIKPGGLSAGEHKIEVILMLRAPYMPLPGGKDDHDYMPIDSCGEKVLSIVEDVEGPGRGEENEQN